MSHEDPGWRPAIEDVWRYLIPILGGVLRARDTRREANGLVRLRREFVSFIPGLLFFLIALAFIAPFDREGGTWLSGSVLVAGLVSIGGALWVRGRGLSTASQEALAGSYQVAFFIGIGFAELAALWGAVVVILGGGLWLYMLGAAFTLVSLWLIAPTARDIARRQRDITASGSPLSMSDALVEMPPRGQPGGAPST